MFSAIYGISVLTHLSESANAAWIDELNRILIPKGILYLTTAGAAFKEKMTASEISKFENNEIIAREQVKEGHRMYSTFHPVDFTKSMFEKAGFQILDHVPGKRITPTYISQDKWIVRKT
jgi:hypothetical protein